MIMFKEGTYKLNKQSNFDYQLNRAIMYDGDPDKRSIIKWLQICFTSITVNILVRDL